MPARERAPRTVPGDRKGFFYYESAEQKQLIEERAREANRRVSSYILHTLLSAAGDQVILEDRAKRLTEEAQRWREDYWKVKAERDELAQRVQDSERLNRDLLLQLEKANSLRGKEHELTFHDMRVWRILLNAKTEHGFEPVLERNILIELDVVDEPEYVRLIKDRLAAAAEHGILEKVEVRGKLAYRWMGPEEA